MALALDESSQLYRYLKKFQQDPTSRVFAPLAEAYRKAGLTQEAVEIAREGLLHHPTFMGGRVALARALFDMQKFEDVLQELKPVIRDAPDNLVAQKLSAESSLMLGRVADALASYKMLLFFMPDDVETAKLVGELETQSYEKGSLLVQQLPAETDFSVRPFQSVLAGDPDRKRRRWMHKVELLQAFLERIARNRKDQPKNLS